jgi:hypothetical protein
VEDREALDLAPGEGGLDVDLLLGGVGEDRLTCLGLHTFSLSVANRAPLRTLPSP